ncbi:GNAT family N-acetyltransferase [Kordiimonas sp.]|uniref:GNAT family N-acetyltransferase n=1 Tax=Kordiimonas sp. TaxID=1970157 RepID=UPI003A8E8848
MASFYRTRPAGEEDIFFIRALELDPANQYVHAWDETTHRDKMAEPTYRYLIAENAEGKAIGFAILNYNSPNRLEWKRIVVARRSDGIGTAFMRDVLSQFTADPVLEVIWLDVYAQNDRARHVYRSLGFQEVREDRETVPGETLVIMEYTPSPKHQ